MKHRVLAAAALLTAAASLNAQGFQRRAVITGGGSPNGGKCTIEVVVDGAAEVEVRGDTATLRNLSGQPPQWRRFQCTGIMPPNPGGFRFAGVDGRGRQDLIRDPRNGGPAVVRIEDPDNGSEGYTFDLFWGGPENPPPPPPRGGFDDRGRPDDRRPDDRRPDDRRYDDGDRDRDRDRDRGDFDGPGRRFTIDQAVRVCQDAVRQQAMDRFRTRDPRDINFLRTSIDDRPGRNDWVIGSLTVRRRFGRDDIYQFSCSVNFDNGRVRTAQIDTPR